MTIHELIKKERIRQGLSTDRMAIKMHDIGVELREPSYKRREKGITPFTAEEVKAIAKILGKPLDFFIN